MGAASALAFSAGLAFCVVGVSARSLDPPDSPWRLILEPLVWAIVVNAFAAAVVFAIMFTTKTALAAFIGLAYLDDRVRPGFAAVAVVGFGLAIAAAVGVAHYASRARPTRSTTTPGHHHVTA